MRLQIASLCAFEALLLSSGCTSSCRLSAVGGAVGGSVCCYQQCRLPVPSMISDDGGASRSFFITRDKALAIFFVWIMQVVFGGVFYSFAQFYSLIKDSFSNSTYAYIGFVGTALSGFSNFVGPLSAGLVLNYGYMPTVTLSAVVFALGFIATSYDDMQWELFFTYSLLIGVSGGVMNHMSMGFLTDSLSSREELGYGLAISNTGTGCGLIMVSCIAAYYCNVNDYATWQELFRSLSLLAVAVLAAAAIVVWNTPADLTSRYADDHREVEIVFEQRGEGDALIDTEKKDMKLSGAALLFSSDRRALLLFISNIAGLAFTPVPFKFSIIYATANIDDANMYFYAPIALGVGTIISRFVFNLAASGTFGKKISSLSLQKILLLGSLFGSLLLAFVDSSSTSAVLSSLFIFALFNNFLPILLLRTVDTLGHRNHHSNTGVQLFALGIAYCLGGFLSGLIFDYAPIEYVFITSAVSFFCAIIFDEVVFYEASVLKSVFSI